MEAWLIYFDDSELPPEVFTGPDCEDAAKTRYKSLALNWSVTLFEAVGRSKPSAEQAPAGQAEMSTEDQMMSAAMIGPTRAEIELRAQLSTTREIARKLAEALEVGLVDSESSEGGGWAASNRIMRAALAKARAAGLLDAQRPAEGSAPEIK